MNKSIYLSIYVHISATFLTNLCNRTKPKFDKFMGLLEKISLLQNFLHFFHFFFENDMNCFPNITITGC